MTPPSNRPPTNGQPTGWRHAPAPMVKARIAQLALADSPPLTIGEISLLPHQRRALARIRAAIREFHGALLADEVGLGKTYVALALARDYSHTHVIAPAALLPMWRNAIARSGSTALTLHSLHAFSASAHTARSAADTRHDRHPDTREARAQLVIIDEAHHLRTPTTQRYRAVADFVAGRDVLLLSATPIHNTARELRQLLALFAGRRDDLITDPLLARVIVRHTARDIDVEVKHPTGIDRGHRHAQRDRRTKTPPRVCEHPPRLIPTDRAILDAILALPAPLPARDGAVAGALIRLGLLRAWCSSDAALSHTLMRRLLRGEALQQALVAGRHPTVAELRTWLVGEHEVQLAFPELLAAHSNDDPTLLDDLQRHLDAVRDLREQLHHINKRTTADSARASALRAVIAEHPDVPIIAFSQFTRTVQSLYRALSDIAGVGALTGMHARIASGRISRVDAISRFAPSAQGRPPPPTHQAIRILITTDLLAEGVNLQDAAVLVHLDLPWTDALLRQRIGRIARLGSPHQTVHVYRLLAPAGEEALQLTKRLLKKARLSARFVGGNTSPRHASAADATTRLARLLRRWLDAPQRHPTHTAHDSAPSPPAYPDTRRRVAIVAQVESSRAGWIAAFRVGACLRLLGHDGRTTTNARRLGRLVRDAAFAPAESAAPAAPAAPASTSAHPSRHEVSRALRQLHRWAADDRLATTVGANAHQLAPPQQQALHEIATIVADAPPLRRPLLADLARHAETVVYAAHGISAQRALEQWLRTRHDVASRNSPSDDGRWLSSWRDWEPLGPPPPTATTHTPEHHRGAPDHCAVEALLLLRPAPKGG